MTVEARYLNPNLEADPTNEQDGRDLPDWAHDLLGELRWALYGPLDYAVVADKPAR